MRIATFAICAVIALGGSGCGFFDSDKKPPDISFAPYGEGYSEKPDFAQLEYQYPLSPKDLYKITPKNLSFLDQEQVDQIYARLSAGPIPDGPSKATCSLRAVAAASCACRKSLAAGCGSYW